jgi:SWI/SNF chromatin-remodeling complex subunit SWI1
VQGGQQGQGNFPQATPQQAAEKQRQLALMMQQLQHQRMQQAAYARSQQQQVLDSQQASAPDPSRGQAIPPQSYGNPSSQMHGQSQQFTQQQAQEQYLQQQLQHYQNQNSNSGQMRPVTPSTKLPPIGMAQQSPMSRDPPQSHIPGPSSAQNPLFQDRRPSLSVNPMMQETMKQQQQQQQPPTTRPFPETVPPVPPVASTSSYPSRPDDRPPPAKRARYKVEYHPLVRDITTAGGWDLHALNQGREAQLRCYQNLEVEDFGKIDIEGLCMSLRCGLSHEVSYALTALAMLSMPGKGQDKGGLGLAHCGELLSDLVDLVDLNAFGERGWQGWSLSVDAPRGKQSRGSSRKDDPLTPVSSRSDSARMAHHAQDAAWALESTSTGYNLTLASQSASTLREAAEVEARSYSFLFDPVVTRNIERSKKRVDTSLVAINLLRNFSMMSDNFGPMTEYHDLLECLMRVCDLRMAKLPEQELDNDDPAVFTLMDLLRIRHDVLDTILNLAHDLDLSKLSTYAQRAIFDLLNSYISDVPCTNTSYRLTDDLFGETGRLVPARTEWAIEALTRITTKDCNRRCLRQLPAKSIVSSFHTLLRYLPLSIKDGYSINLVYPAASELLLRVVFCLYSLAWLSPLTVRTEIRDTTDAIPVLTLAVRRLMTLKPHPTSTIIVRRLMAVLGALNGASDELVDDGPAITFGANASVRGLNGWNDTKHCVQPGLLAGQEDLLTDMVMLASAQGVQLDAMTVDELEKAIWAKNSP